MVQCPSCARPQAPRLICPDCQAPLAAKLDLFAALGLPPKLRVDKVELEAAYHELGRRLHPDRFATAPVKVRDASLRATALLTRAYRTLRDPLTRASYWLELKMGKAATQSQQVPAAIAELVFDVQDELTELRDAGSRGDEKYQAARQQVNERRSGVVSLLDGLGIRMEATFDALDQKEDAAAIDRLETLLAETAYLKTLLRDIDKALDTRLAA